MNILVSCREENVTLMLKQNKKKKKIGLHLTFIEQKKAYDKIFKQRFVCVPEKNTKGVRDASSGYLSEHKNISKVDYWD